MFMNLILLQKGFIIRTPRGRMATEKAYKHLNRHMNNQIVKEIEAITYLRYRMII